VPSTDVVVFSGRATVSNSPELPVSQCEFELPVNPTFLHVTAVSSDAEALAAAKAQIDSAQSASAPARVLA
jgi:hypothetical protein